MASRALQVWRTASAQALDEIAAAHAAVGGNARGRRYTTQQINQAYVVLLSSRFQLFCRDLHTETTAELVRDLVRRDQTLSAQFQTALQFGLTGGRSLDRGNPNPRNIAEDFARLGMRIWDDVNAMHALNPRRRQLLELMLAWRNAIGHQDFSNQALQGRTVIHLGEVREFRRVCNALAGYFDRAALDHIHAVAGPQAGW
jgi:hypothetical protein